MRHRRCRATGATAHPFILDAIEQTVKQAEFQEELHRIADQRWAKVVDTGKTVSWDAAKSYVAARLRGERARKPASRTFKR